MFDAAEPFEKADEPTLTGICDPIVGGGYYHMKNFENKPVNRDLWLCDVTRFVLGNVPERIFIKRMQ